MQSAFEPRRMRWDDTHLPAAIDLCGELLLPESGQLELRWKDGQTTLNSFAELRRKCPCATCRTEREKIEVKSPKGPLLRVINAAGPVVQTAEILEVNPIGRYALAFRFNDGHQTGIYTYEFLYEIRLPQELLKPLP